MFVLYCIGIAAIGVALIGAMVGVIAGNRLFAMVNTMLSFVRLTGDFLTVSSLTGDLACVLCFDARLRNIHGCHCEGYQFGK